MAKVKDDAPLKTKLICKYKFLHYLRNKPVKAEDKQTKKTTEYPLLVDKIIAKLSDKVVTTTKYNQVVKQTEKAVATVDSLANGDAMRIRRMLPDMLYDAMLRNNKGLTVDALPLGVYHLERIMRERLIIS